MGTRIVQRNRLTRRLQAGMERPLTLIVAPTGYGKTTLLTEMIPIISLADWRTAWVSLDSFDNLPIRFWMYLSAALQKAEPLFQFNAESLLEGGYDLNEITILNPFFNAIAQIPHSICLILDDYQAISNANIHHSLNYFIERLPQNLHLVIASRSFPPIAVSRLRAQGQCLELTAADLSFQADEAQTFFSEVMGLQMGPDQVTRLVTSTEGWIAGLQLAALTMQKKPAFPAIQAERLSIRRQVTDYLIEAVLTQLDAQTQDFLLKTSILTELSAPLCDAVLERSDSQQILTQISRDNLFIAALDNDQRWFRYHSLFAEALSAHLELSNPEILPDLHRRACAWLLNNGHTERAIEHALAAGDTTTAARIVEDCGMQAMTRFSLSNLVRWIGCFSKDLLRRHPRLGIDYALANILLGRLDLAEAELQDLEQALRNGLSKQLNAEETNLLTWEIAALRVMSDCICGNHNRAIRHGLPLIANAPREDRYIEGSLYHWLAITYSSIGELETARSCIEKAGQFAYTHKIHTAYMHARCELAHLCQKQGRLGQAEQALQQALDYARQNHLETSDTALVLAGLINLAIERNTLAAAVPWVRELENYLAENDASTQLYLHPVILSTQLAKYYLALRNLEQVRFYYQKSLDALHSYRGLYTENIIDLIDLQSRVCAVTHKNPPSDWWARDRLPPAAPTDELILIQQTAWARAVLNQRHPDQARAMLEELESIFQKVGMTEALIENQILQALAQYEEDHREAAYRRLGRALKLAALEGYVRFFLDEGEPMRNLLEEYRVVLSVQNGGERSLSAADGYPDVLLDAFNRCARPVTPATEPLKTVILQPINEPFSSRETEILELLVTGRTIKEIAGMLMISCNTAKTHVKNIYRKLNTHTRKQMLQRAAELGLVPQSQ